MIAGNPLVTLVFQAQDIGVKVNPRGFEQLEIMDASQTKAETNNFLSVSLDNNLALQSMVLLLTGVEPVLLTFRAFNRSFCDIHDDNIRPTKALD